MDQDLLQRAYKEHNHNCCAYEKAILARYCNCSLAERLCIAEREGINCNSVLSRARCLSFLDLLRSQARFLLKNTLQSATISHAKMLKIQAGGLLGLQSIVHTQPDNPSRTIQDANELLEAAKTQFGSMENLPFHILIQHIAAFEGRPRHHRRG